jgi:hypothetical protein
VVRSNAVLYFNATIGPGKWESVPVRPQLPFQGRRLAYAGPPNTFMLLDIKVRHMSHRAAGGGACRMELFPPLPPDLAGIEGWLNNCGVEDIAKPGDEITLEVLNVSDAPASFDALMFGEVRIEGWRRP